MNHLDKEQLGLMNSIVDSITDSNNNVFRKDYLTNDNFSKEDYFNADHLNKRGAEKLTNMINDYIEVLSN